MNWFDILIVLPVLVGLVRGLMRGFVSEIIAFAVVIFGAIGARIFAPQFSKWLIEQFAWPNGTCEVVAYVVVFLAVSVILSLLARVVNKLLKAIHLGWANAILGGTFGMCKYGLLVLIVVFILSRTNDEYHYLDDASVVQQSVLYPKVVNATHVLLSVSRKQSGQS